MTREIMSVVDGLRTTLPYDVPPGWQATVAALVAVPTSPGAYTVCGTWYTRG